MSTENNTGCVLKEKRINTLKKQIKEQQIYWIMKI